MVNNHKDNNKEKQNIKKNDISSTVENIQRINLGLPSGDPHTGTNWKDTLIVIVTILIVFFLYIFLK